MDMVNIAIRNRKGNDAVAVRCAVMLLFLLIGIPAVFAHAAAFDRTAALTLTPAADSQNNRGNPDLLARLTHSPELTAVSLSSDGHYLMALIGQEDGDGVLGVWRSSAGPETAEYLPYTRPEIDWIAWIGEGRLLISLKQRGLVLYDAHTQRLRPLIERDGPRPNELPPVLLSTLPDDSARVLLQWEDPAVPGYPAVYKVDVIAGTSEKILGAWRPIIRWWASPSGVIEMGEGYRGRTQHLFGRRAGGEWDTITQDDFFSGPAKTVLAVEPGGATAVILSGHAGNTRSLWRMDTRTGDFITELAAHDRFDITGVILDTATGNLLGAGYVADASESIILRPDFKDELSQAAAKIGIDDIELSASSTDGDVKLYRVRYNWRPDRYFIVGAARHDAKSGADETVDDVREVRFSAPLKENLPQAASDDDALWPRLKSRGVWIPLKGRRRSGLGPMHAILTTPENGTTGKAVVLVHGGPVRRASDRFNPFVSWLVANGYTVLQPNFRGSSGFGERWRRAGYAQWGGDMQEDVRTATEWLINAGFADKKSMCIVGGSYGGYAALMSTIRDDDLFACAVSLNGVTSVHDLVKYLNTLRFNLLTVPRIKGRLSDRSLIRRSPLYRAELVRLPVLLLHATNDLNVPFDQGTKMAEVLERHGKPYRFIVLDGAEHQLDRAKDRYTYYQEALNFMEAYIQPGRR